MCFTTIQYFSGKTRWNKGISKPDNHSGVIREREAMYNYKVIILEAYT